MATGFLAGASRHYRFALGSDAVGMRRTGTGPTLLVNVSFAFRLMRKIPVGGFGNPTKSRFRSSRFVTHLGTREVQVKFKRFGLSVTVNRKSRNLNLVQPR